MTVLLGCIADDFTGATDLAGMLVKAGMRTVQLIGVPSGPVPDDVDAIVIALKSRTNPPQEAVAESLLALQWLQTAGCRQYYQKYCSTFDSTPAGNIGPVADALLDALGSDFTIACPAFPANGRTVYKGHLFVQDALLSDSGMRHHPLTPMTDASLVRLLQPQVRAPVGLVGYDIVRQGAAAVGRRFAQLREEGCRYAVVDALADADLHAVGTACAELPLVTGGSGIALGLPDNFRRAGLLAATDAARVMPATGGHRAVISGSCSAATLRQVAQMRAHSPSFELDPLALANGVDVPAQVLAWAADLLPQGPVLVYASASPERVREIHAAVGAGTAGALVEDALAAVAVGLVGLGVGELIVAGGETSGAVVKALGVQRLRIGVEIDPGVPWTTTLGQRHDGMPLALALKSGNFGSDDFFTKAWACLP